MKKILKALGIGCIGLIGIFLFIVIIGSFFGGDSELDMKVTI